MASLPKSVMSVDTKKGNVRLYLLLNASGIGRPGINFYGRLENNPNGHSVFVVVMKDKAPLWEGNIPYEIWHSNTTRMAIIQAILAETG